jgi:hypothetical protein
MHGISHSFSTKSQVNFVIGDRCRARIVFLKIDRTELEWNLGDATTKLSFETRIHLMSLLPSLARHRTCAAIALEILQQTLLL